MNNSVLASDFFPDSNRELTKPETRKIAMNVVSAIGRAQERLHPSWKEVCIPGQFQDFAKKQMSEAWVSRVVSRCLYPYPGRLPEDTIYSDTKMEYLNWVFSMDAAQLYYLLEAMLWRIVSNQIRNDISPKSKDKGKKKLGNDATIFLLANDDLPKNILMMFKGRLKNIEDSIRSDDIFQENCIKLAQLWLSGFPPNYRMLLKTQLPFHGAYNNLSLEHGLPSNTHVQEMKEIFDKYFIYDEIFHEFMNLYLESKVG